MNHRGVFILLICFGVIIHESKGGDQNAPTDTVRLSQCLTWAEEHLPVLQQRGINDELLQNKLSQLSKSYLPSWSVNGQATYQSDVPELPFEIPGTPGIDIPNEQYKIWLEASQLIYDGGITQAQKQVEEASRQVQNQALDVTLFQFKKQVVQIYFSALTIERQRSIATETINLLEKKEQALQAALEHGTIQENDLLKIQSEIIVQNKNLKDLSSIDDQARTLLGILTGKDVDEVHFMLDQQWEENLDIPSKHPELALIDQRETLQAQRADIAQAGLRPKINLFGQAGYGHPNPYNFFKSNGDTYYMAGIRATWKITDWGKTSLEKQNIKLEQLKEERNKDQKIEEIETRIATLNNEQTQLENAIEQNEKLLTIREQIRKNASVQLDQGIITSTDYLDDVIAEHNTRTTLETDKIQLKEKNILMSFEQLNNKD